MKKFGYLASLFLILCALPEIWVGYSTGNVGASWGLIILWFLGEICGLIYTIWNKDKPLMLNYLINTILVGVLIWMKMN